MNGKERLVRQFNRSAVGSYDDHALVQARMAKRLASLLRLRRFKETSMRDPELAEIGCGTGTLTELLARRFPDTRLTAMDIAPSMLAAAESRLRALGIGAAIVADADIDFDAVFESDADSDTDSDVESVANAGFENAPAAVGEAEPRETRVRFVLADVERWSKDGSPAAFDFIVSNACFQWLNRPESTLASLRRLLRSGGSLAFSTFGPGTFRELHDSFDEAYRTLGMEPRRHGLALRAAREWLRMLREAGFVSITCRREAYVEEHASPGAFLHAVKAVGASASEGLKGGMGQRRLFKAMYHAYETRHSSPSGVRATYEALYFQCQSP